MYPDKNGGDWGPLATILIILGIVFPPMGVIILIIALLS